MVERRYGIVLVEDIPTVDHRMLTGVKIPSMPMPVYGPDLTVVAQCVSMTNNGGVVSVTVDLEDSVAGKDWYVSADVDTSVEGGSVVETDGVGNTLVISNGMVCALYLSDEGAHLWAGMDQRLKTEEQVQEDFAGNIEKMKERMETLMDFVVMVDDAAKADNLESVKLALEWLTLKVGNMLEEEEGELGL